MLKLILGALAGAVLGLVVGVAAVAVHPWWWGLLLAAAGSLATLVALAPGALRIAYAAVWAVVVALAASPRPTGGFAVAGDLPGYAMITLAVVMLVGACVTLPSLRHPPGRTPVQTDTRSGGARDKRPKMGYGFGRRGQTS